MNSLISIIIPIYNVSPYIEHCLQSVIDQTYVNLDVILIDDCGSDDSMAIAEKIVSDYQGPIKFKLLHHDHNRGLSAARNTGINNAIGEWLFFLDSDDWIYPNCIQMMVEGWQKYPTIDLVQGCLFSEDIDVNNWIHNCIQNKSFGEYSNNIKEIRHYLQSHTHMPMAQNRLINKKWLIENNLFFKEGIIHEDEHWTMRVARVINSLYICDKDSYFYRINTNGITAKYNTHHLYSICIICDDLCRTLNYATKNDEILYICHLLESATRKAKVNAIENTSVCRKRLFKLTYNLYCRRWFEMHRTKVEKFISEILLLFVFIDCRISFFNIQNKNN